MPGQFKGIRGVAQEYIESLIEEGLTNTQIVGILQDYGMSYRLQHMYSDVNRLRLEQFAGEGLKGFDVNTPIPSNLMREWEGDTSYKYRVVIQYEYSPSDDGETTTGATTLYYDRPPTQNEVLEDWDVRVKTIEGGFLGYEQISQIEGIAEINYFYNVPKRM